MYPDETVYLWDEGRDSAWICDECLGDAVRELTTYQLAELIGSERQSVGVLNGWCSSYI